jgi:Rps23 Pro-64 3,4-dihydroxylase Tpa1-like proline 4-hydroxylase
MSMPNEMGDPPVALNPDLEVEGLRERFARTGRLQIRNAFHPDTAERLHRCLMQEMPWMLAYNDGETPSYLRKEDMATMTPDQQGAFMQKIFANAAQNFQYVYLDFPVSGTAKVEGQRKFYTHDVLTFLGGEEFQSVLRSLTGYERPLQVDSHATCFQAGHFLTVHDDLVNKNDPRVFAYVVNMTKDWRGDWGAKTEFFDAEGNVIESFIPVFNSITVFRVPQPHSVTFVPPFCPARRVAMTGWFFRPETDM